MTITQAVPILTIQIVKINNSLLKILFPKQKEKISHSYKSKMRKKEHQRFKNFPYLKNQNPEKVDFLQINQIKIIKFLDNLF